MAASAATNLCGSVLRQADLPLSKLKDYSVMCYLSVTEEAIHVDTVCSDLLVDLPGFGDAKGLEAFGGEYGCWLTRDLKDPFLSYACTSGFGHTAAISKCSHCKTLAVCIKYPDFLNK